MRDNVVFVRCVTETLRKDWALMCSITRLKTVQEKTVSKILQVTLLTVLTSTGKKNLIRKCVEDTE